MFINLHNHSEYSLLDGLSKPIDMAKKAKALGQTAIALTDHGNMFGTIEFYKACKKENIKPICGIECYVAPETIDPSLNKKYGRRMYHLILLAKNYKGYQNLCNIASQSYLSGFYYKPRIDFDLLSKFGNDIIVSSACIAGQIPKLLLEDKKDEADKVTRMYKERFGKDFYIELMNHEIPEELKIIPQLVRLAKKYDIKTIATNDSHYVNKHNAYAHDVLLCIQQLRRIDDPKRMKFDNDSFYLQSEKEMLEKFKGIEEAVYNTEEVANKCNLEFDFSERHLPKFIAKGVNTEADRFEYMKQLIKNGLRKRYDTKITQEIIDRVKYELKVIKDMNFIDYFLVVQDFVNHAKNSGIAVGVGRGSALGCLISYLLNITEADPLKYNLYFERFLNPGRKSMPDIDIDFENSRRDEVIQYVTEKYGNDCVSQIGTFGRLESKAAFRDVARAFNIPANEININSKKIPSGFDLSTAYRENHSFQRLIDADKKYSNIYNVARTIEHAVRNFSTHACGVLISDKSLWNYVPLAIDKNKKAVCMYEKNTVEELGLLKMDFLGLKNLTTIKNCQNLIEKNKNKKINFSSISLDNKKTYELYTKGQTKGVFQVESPGMQKWLKELKPDNIEDIISMVALYRPGPMKHIKEFINNKRDSSKIKLLHKDLKPLLKDTYGICIYQEQNMSIAKTMAGFSLAEADDLRKAMGHKIASLMEEQRTKFIDGCIKNGYEEELAKDLFEILESFAAYGFNRAHSVGYGLLSYQTAYLKANYTTEFMCALLNTYCEDEHKTETYCLDCETFGINIDQVDINNSFMEFTINKDKRIQYGFNAIKGLVTKDVYKIVHEREKNGNFISIYDFMARCGTLNKRTKEQLSKAGAFDSFENNRRIAVNLTKDKQLKGISLFSDEEEQSIVKDNKQTFNFSYEKEAYGFYLSDNPISYFNESFSYSNISKVSDLNEIDENSYVKLFCLIDKVEVNKHTNKGKIIHISDLSGSTTIFAFSKYAQVIEDIISFNCEEQSLAFLLTVRVKLDGEYKNITVQSIDGYHRFSEALVLANRESDLYIKVKADSFQEKDMTKVVRLLRKNKGSNSMFLEIEYKDIELHTGESEFKIKKNIKFSQELKKIIGEKNIKWKSVK